MKLHALQIEGFGPFRTRQHIDFDAFDGDGLFLISGKTGAGKSSILDAVCFSLYGSIPRYSSGEKGLRSDYSELGDVSEVVLEFSVATGRYRIARSPEYERPKSRGTGTTMQKASVELARWNGTAWEGLGARARDVDGEILREILQLSREQFLQVILLAQNGFAGFLKAGSGERLTVLRTLFGTERFAAYAADLAQRRRDADAAVAEGTTTLELRLGEAEAVLADAHLDDDEDASPEPGLSRLDALRGELPRLREHLTRAQNARETTRAERAAAAAALDELRTVAQRQAELGSARGDLAVLDADAAQIDAHRARAESAGHAEAMRSALDTCTDAEDSATRARAAVAEAAPAWSAASPDALRPDELRADELRAEAAAAATLVGTLTAGIEAERSHPATQRAEEAADAAVAAAAEALTAHEARTAQIPARIAEIDAALAALAPRVAGRARAHELVGERTLLREAAVRAEAAATVAARADAGALAAGAALRAASEHVAALITRRLQGYAGELATHLVPGAPCAVCGSTEHPAPAAAADDVVTDDDVDKAQRDKDVAVSADAAAADAASTARAELTAAVAAAGGHDVAAATALIAEAEADVAAADAAHEEAAAQQLNKDALVADGAAATRDADALRETHAAALAAQATAAERTRHSAAVIAEARGDADTVQARRDAVEARRVAAERLATLLDELRSRELARDEATARLDAALAASAFPDRAALVAALLPAAERTRLDTLVREYDERRTRLRGIIDRLVELAPPQESVDLAPPTARLAEADLALSGAERTLAAAEQTLAAFERALIAAEDTRASVGDALKRRDTMRRLADAVNGHEPNTMKMSLETFVLAAELEQIVAAANIRLAEMSTGRYSLAHTDSRAAHGAASGLGIEVIDAHTGRGRPASSLSGGETFLASLALALGLAEVVTARAGGVRLDTLFIDEGFGSLDAETLDTAMRTLDALRAGGRTVGVISHVEAMHHQIPARLLVRVRTDGSSVVEQDIGADEPR